MQTKEELLEHIKGAMQELFELPPNKVELNSHLYDDLDLDSIDAVDLVIKLKELTGQMAKPEDFKVARTVEDIVNILYKMHQS